MTVRELRERIAALPDEMEVVIRICSDEMSMVCGLRSATVESGCTDIDALTLDGDTDEDESAAHFLVESEDDE
jgi:hypothetical protein